MTANVVNTLHNILSSEGTYILRLLRVIKHKYCVPRYLNKFIYQSLDPYTSESELIREQVAYTIFSRKYANFY